MKFSILKGLFAICRFNPTDEEPSWIDKKQFYTITRTSKELSIVCIQDCLKGGLKAEKGWRILELEGPIDFDLTGVIASITQPLRDANIGVFVLSTFDTDYILVKENLLNKAVESLSKTGFHFENEGN